MDDHINEVFLFNKLSTDKFLWLQVLVGTHRLPKPSFSRCTACMVINLSNQLSTSIKDTQSTVAVIMDQRLGVIIQLRNNAGNIQNSFTSCGSTYAVSTGYTAFAKCVFFSGSELFTSTDLEVFYEITSQLQDYQEDTKIILNQIW